MIEEEDEAPSQFDQTETGKCYRRPSSAASPRSGREEKVGIQRRASSAGKIDGKIVNLFLGLALIVAQILYCLKTRALP